MNHRINHWSIEPTDICNLHCTSCRRSEWVAQSKQHGRGIMTPNTFKKIIKIISKEPTTKKWGTRYLQLFWRGEPCISPHLPTLAKITNEYGYRTITSTNCSVPLLNNRDYVQRLLDNFSEVEFCVDGFNQETIDKYRVGANWKTMLKTLEIVSNLESFALKKMRVLMFKWNEGREEQFRKFAKRYGMNELLFGSPIINGSAVITRKQRDEWIASDDKYCRYKLENDEYVSDSRKTCNLHAVVAYNGDVGLCALDMPLKYKLGNILKDGIEEVKKNYLLYADDAYLRRLPMCKQFCCCMPNKPVNIREKII